MPAGSVVTNESTFENGQVRGTEVRSCNCRTETGLKRTKIEGLAPSFWLARSLSLSLPARLDDHTYYPLASSLDARNMHLYLLHSISGRADTVVLYGPSTSTRTLSLREKILLEI